MQIDFSGQTALVTGATRGIGRQVAEDLLRLGARLILTGTKPDEIDRLNAEARDGETFLCADFSQRDSLRAFLETLARQERIDVCVNNAGINRVDAVDEIRDDDLDAVTEVNLRAPILITRTVARLMKRHRYGRIVNISSIWGHISWTKRAVYASTKFAIRGLRWRRRTTSPRTTFWSTPCHRDSRSQRWCSKTTRRPNGSASKPRSR